MFNEEVELMQNKSIYVLIAVLISIIFASCTGQNEKTADSRSMEQIYAEEGKPVNVRAIKPESFSVSLSFPAEFRAQNQSIAYSDISDVVREVRVKIGDKVKRDQVVLVLSHDNSAYQQAKLRLENLESEYNRLQVLFRDGGVSKQSLDNIQTQYELAREAFRAAREMIEIKAPIDGYVTQLYVHTSSDIKSGDALFTISNNDGFEALFYVSVDEISQIKTGSPASIENRGELLIGRISEISLTMDAEKKAFPVKAFFSEKPIFLVSGMSVDVSVETYRKSNAIVINRNETINTEDGFYVFVVNGDAAEKRIIKTGREKGLLLEVTEGLYTDDHIVSKGIQDLTDGMRVRVVGSTAAKQE